jgi:hypothetical protein
MTSHAADAKLLLGLIVAFGMCVTSGSTSASDPTELVIRMTVDAMPAPKPALRYLLLPELKELHPGNPIPNYLKCLMDQDFSSDRETLSPSALRLADWAARLDTPDWQILTKLRQDGFSTLIPDVQKMRTLANALQERFRHEVAERNFDAAIRTAKTMFALSRHMGKHPTLVGSLVGIALASITIEPLEEMLQQPGCPNLYWALTNLPKPLVSLDKGWEGERMMIGVEFRELTDQRPMTADEIEKVIKHIEFLIAVEAGHAKPRAFLAAQAKKPSVVRAARRRLIEAGLPADRVARFPVFQVLLLEDERRFDIQRDEIMKLMNLPDWQFDAQARKIKPPRERALFEALMPSLVKVRHAQARLAQRIALLRHVEALRLYAAAHAGRLPKTLADISVPLPNDPMTGKPFRYQLKGVTAHLRGTPPPGLEKVDAYNVHYEISIRK